MLGQQKDSVLGSLWSKGATHTSGREQHMLAKLEAYERNLALCEQASGEKISDGLRVGIVRNRATGHRACDALVVEF